VLDTHAGCGIYDLTASEAARTGEAARGALRLADNPAPALAPSLN
jgi:23S rRNA (adenine2030-N6)-methyltransferase